MEDKKVMGQEAPGVTKEQSDQAISIEGMTKEQISYLLQMKDTFIRGNKLMMPSEQDVPRNTEPSADPYKPEEESLNISYDPFARAPEDNAEPDGFFDEADSDADEYENVITTDDEDESDAMNGDEAYSEPVSEPSPEESPEEPEPEVSSSEDEKAPTPPSVGDNLNRFAKDLSMERSPKADDTNVMLLQTIQMMMQHMQRMEEKWDNPRGEANKEANKEATKESNKEENKEATKEITKEPEPEPAEEDPVPEPDPEPAPVKTPEPEPVQTDVQVKDEPEDHNEESQRSITSNEDFLKNVVNNGVERPAIKKRSLLREAREASKQEHSAEEPASQPVASGTKKSESVTADAEKTAPVRRSVRSRVRPEPVPEPVEEEVTGVESVEDGNLDEDDEWAEVEHPASQKTENEKKSVHDKRGNKKAMSTEAVSTINQPFTRNKGRSSKAVIIVLILIILGLIGAGAAYYFLHKDNGNTVKTESSGYGNLRLDTTANSEKSDPNDLSNRNVYFSGIDNSSCNKDTVIYLENLPENEDFLMKYEIYELNEDGTRGEMVFSTDLIPSGQHVNWKPAENLSAGTHNISFLEQPFVQSGDDFIPLTAGENQVVLTIVE